MTINALRIHREGIGTETILLTIKDIAGMTEARDET
jgi:hypothetical protein